MKLVKIGTGHAIQSSALHVVIAAALFAASCAEAPGTPTAPSASAGTLSSTPQALGGALSASSPQAVLVLTKTCDAIDHCAVITSPSGPIPVDSDINYFGPLLESRTTSRILIATPSGDTADGNCSLSYKTIEGTCVITGGTGALAGLHANVKVFLSDPAGVFTWEGRYHFER